MAFSDSPEGPGERAISSVRYSEAFRISSERTAVYGRNLKSAVSCDLINTSLHNTFPEGFTVLGCCVRALVRTVFQLGTYSTCTASIPASVKLSDRPVEECGAKYGHG